MTRTILAFAVIAIIGVASLIGGCTDVTTTEHREDKTVHAAAANIVLDVSTINGNVEIRESADYNVTVTYDVFASPGHLLDVRTGTNGSRIDNDSVSIKAEAKLSGGIEGLNFNRGANILVTVPGGSLYTLNLVTNNGNIIVPALNGGTAVLNTLNGNVGITGGNFSESIDARTSNGDVMVKLPEGTMFYVDASTLNGHVRHGLIHMTPQKETERELVGYTEAGSGSLRMKLSTLNGNVEISY